MAQVEEVKGSVRILADLDMGDGRNSAALSDQYEIQVNEGGQGFSQSDVRQS